MRQILLWICLLLILAWPSVGALAANNGHIVFLTLSGASSPGGCIDINAQVQADSDVGASNLYYELFAPSGSRIAIRQVNPPSLVSGQTYSDGWSYCNPPATGTYSVTLCWSTGNGNGTGNGNVNCNIDGAVTNGYSVPTMGWVLGLASMGLLGVFLYRRRADFVRVDR